jgi:hypothetical protein
MIEYVLEIQFEKIFLKEMPQTTFERIRKLPPAVKRQIVHGYQIETIDEAAKAVIEFIWNNRRKEIYNMSADVLFCSLFLNTFENITELKIYKKEIH